MQAEAPGPITPAPESGVLAIESEGGRRCIAEELDALRALLAARRGRLPAEIGRALAQSDWLRDQVAWPPPPAPGRSPWVPAVAAASICAGLITAPPGFALPAPPLPRFTDSDLVPPPPVLGGHLAPVVAVQPAPADPLPAPAAGTVAAKSPAAGSAPAKVPAGSATEEALAVPAAQPADPAEPVLGEAAPPIRLPFEGRQVIADPAPAARPASARPAAARPAKPGPAAARSDESAASAQRWHVVKPGDTLIKLARRYYQGAGARWKGLFAFNRQRVRDADRIFPGDRIVIPTLAEAIAAERGHAPVLAAAEAISARPAHNAAPARRGHRTRHKTRVARAQEPILRPRPGLPI
ncbi:MAG: LysM peptidoglycan-binding domain-containing protein [Candidatus Sericytochromatia bacterium]|nr:LysM peptidoglycan-binding domain-containing protein [Candidatus Tanganyikabacteria bacterium]